MGWFTRGKKTPTPEPRRLPSTPTIRVAQNLARQAVTDPIIKALAERAYDAATIGRLNGDWVVSHSDANEELRRALRTLVASARNMERNNSLYQKWMELLENNVVHTGFQLRPEPRNTRGSIDKAAAKMLLDGWREWTSEPVSLDGRLYFNDLEKQILRTLVRDGEVLLVFHIRQGRLRVQVLEGDHMPLEIHSPRDQDMVGIRLNSDRAPQGYWLLPNHPGSNLWGGSSRYSAELIPASRVAHIMKQVRPGQLRGVPWGTSAFDPLLILKGYTIAELAAARLDASRPLGITRDIEGTYPKDEAGDMIGVDGAAEWDGAPGTVTTFHPGETPVWSPSNHPSGQYGPFVLEIKRDIAAGLGVSYNALNSDLTSANYSSLRHGRTEEIRTYTNIQGLLARQVHQRIYEEWLKLFLLSGESSLGMIRYEKFRRVAWETPRFESIDPQKDNAADKEALDLGITSKSEVVGRRGGDYAEVLERRRLDRELEEQNGEPAPAQQTPPATAADEEEPEGNEEDQVEE